MQRCCVALLLFALTCIPSFAQSLPGCEPPVAVRHAIHDQLSGPAFDNLSEEEQTAENIKVYKQLDASYPRQVYVEMRLIRELKDDEDTHPGSKAAVQQHYAELAKLHPNDPLALYLEAYTLIGTNTPEAIRIFEDVKAKDPKFVWPSLQLASIYNSGKFEDQKKSLDNLNQFLAACPASDDRAATWIVSKHLDLQKKVAPSLRAQLEKEKDPLLLKEYSSLWGMEFRTHTPQEYPEVRRQVAADLARLEKVPHKPDADWDNFLLSGYKQTNATPAEVTAREDILLQKYPHSDEAYEIVSARWRKTHKEPDDQKDVAAWTAYRKASMEAYSQWKQQYPDNEFLKMYADLEIVRSDDALTQAKADSAIQSFLAASEKSFGEHSWYPKYTAANVLLDHKWEPQRAVTLLQKVMELRAKDAADAAKSDNLSSKDIEDNKKSEADEERFLRGQLLYAAFLAKDPAAVAPYKDVIEAPVPEKKEDVSGYWLDRARFASLQNQNEDALTYYQQALDTRLKPAQYRGGKLEDELGDEAHMAWRASGGTETAYAVWSKPPVVNTADASNARWEKPTYTIPGFELTDMNGKKWQSSDLKGKVTLINLWATWCGPCNGELPQLEKLYEKVKGRNDVQILTFNIDEDVGLVPAYLEEKKYKFPVLPAYSLVVNLLDGYAIPQNWIIDKEGKWQWTQIGYGSDDSWVQDMVQKLDSVTAGS